MPSSETIFALAELLTITVDPSDSNTTFSEDYTPEESMWRILFFEIVQKTKGVFLVWHLGGFFLAFQLV